MAQRDAKVTLDPKDLKVGEALTLFRTITIPGDDPRFSHVAEASITIHRTTEFTYRFSTGNLFGPQAFAIIEAFRTEPMPIAWLKDTRVG